MAVVNNSPITPPAGKPLDNRPWYMGHSGATISQRNLVQQRARAILESDDYQQSLKARIRSKDLPPAVETMLWYYAFGKPAEQVNVNVSTHEDLSTMSVEQLLQKAQELSKQLEDAKQLEEALPAEYRVG